MCCSCHVKRDTIAINKAGEGNPGLFDFLLMSNSYSKDQEILYLSLWPNPIGLLYTITVTHMWRGPFQIVHKQPHQYLLNKQSILLSDYTVLHCLTSYNWSQPDWISPINMNSRLSLLQHVNMHATKWSCGVLQSGHVISHRPSNPLSG